MLILRELHDRLDAAVASAYGWPAGFDAEAMLDRLVALNAERTVEEGRGLVRWLREDYQVARLGPLVHRAARVRSLGSALPGSGARPLPQVPAERAGAVYDLLRSAGEARTAREIAQAFERPDEALAPVAEALAAIPAVGAAERAAGDRFRAAG